MTGVAHPTIAELIRQRCDETGWSLRALAKATGDRVSSQSMSKLASGKSSEWPKYTSTIEGLADALAVSQEAVVLGFARSLGVPVRPKPSMLAVQLPAEADLLTVEERTHIVGLIRALTANRSGDG